MGITVAIAMGHTATPCNSMDDQWWMVSQQGLLRKWIWL